MELLKTVNLTKSFSTSTLSRVGILWGRSYEKYALRGVSLSICRGEILGLVGESGSGKSTFARCVMHLLEPTSGEIHFNGQEISSLNSKAFRPLRSKMQMIFQSPAASLNPRMKVGSTVLDPVRLHLGLKGRVANNYVVELFQRVGLSARDLGKFPHQLSGGQQQRVGIARAIASNPEFLVLDEPTSALDASVRGQILKLLRNLRNDLGMTYLFISHDLSTIHYICDRAAVMYQGQIVELGDVQELFKQPRHPYTQMLVAAIPRLTAARQRESRNIAATWEGQGVQATERACLFSPRCSIARPKCQEQPPLLPIENGRLVRCWAAIDAEWSETSSYSGSGG
jgi:peptide/nickel transport system ATP-binding protein